MEKLIEVWCLNCHHNVSEWIQEDGTAKVVCPYCQATCVVKVLGRRHIRYDMYAPQGQRILYN